MPVDVTQYQFLFLPVIRLEPITLLKLPIMLLSSDPKSNLLAT